MKCKEGKRVHWLYIDWEIQQRQEAFTRMVEARRKQHIRDLCAPFVGVGIGFLLALILIALYHLIA